MKANIIRIAVLVALALVPAMAAVGSEAPHIQNDAKPLNGTTTLTLEPLWTIGGLDDDVLLGTIERVLTLAGGRLLLLDSQLSHVLECSADGQVTRELGHPGNGPGEITNPKVLVSFADGTLGLVKVFPGQLVMLTPDGLPAGAIKLVAGEGTGGFVTMHRALQAGGTLLIGGSTMTMTSGTPHQSRSFFIGGFDRQGNQIAEYARKDVAIDLSGGKYHESWQEFVWARMGVTDDGTVVANIPRDAFELSWFSPAGQLLRTAAVPGEPWQRNKLARDRMFGILDPQARHAPGTEATPAATEPLVVDLMVRKNGDVWCLTSRSMWANDGGIFAVYDVIDATGRYTRQVKVICEGDATRDRLLLSGDRAYLVTGYWDAVSRVQGSDDDEDAAPMSVTCYQIH